MANFISEDQIEKAVIAVFTEQLSYRHVNCQYQDLMGRTDERDVVIKRVLNEQLEMLNPTLPASAIEEAVGIICHTRFDQSDIAANRELYGLIRNGVPITITNKDGKEEPVFVKVIDFDDETKNDFLVVSQLWVQGQPLRRRPDLIVFVNGLPLVFIELKNSNVALRNAYDDNITNYRHDIPLLFHYNAVCILSNGLETKLGSFNAGFEHFFPWLRPENEKQTPDLKRIESEGISLQYAVTGVCEKRRLLDYVENFILYYNGAIKICGKNHQFLGVNNAVNHFSERLDHDRKGTDRTNKGKLGVFWHTQGSGKSFSMIFFTQKIFRKLTGNFTFLIVTDRDDLDTQIYKNFLAAGAFKKDFRCRPRSSDELRDMLKTNTRYIFTLIQKFRYPKGKAFPVLSERNDIVVIVDEAHRTQYKGLAENMRVGLPKAQYIAFTGTPLLGSKELTREWFGSTISEYNFQQSIDDGATVPLFYHKRVPEVLLQNDDIDEDLAEIVMDENLTDEQQAKLEKEFGQEMSVLKADDRLETIARDIVYHFPRRGYLGKGMVISIDKFTAVRMYDKVRRLWEEEKRNVQREINETKGYMEREELKVMLERMRKMDMAVVVSEEAGEEEKFEKQGLDIKPHRKRMQSVDDNGLDLEEKFKDPKDPFQLVFLCSMWLTGFDAPTVSTLYLDKPMKDHTLMQTIARANRVTDHLILGKPKTNGLVVDYYNVFRNLKKAFASYGGGSIEDGKEDGRSPAQEHEQLFVLLKNAIQECNSYCQSFGVQLSRIANVNEVFSKLDFFNQYADIIVSSDDRKKQFIVYDNTIDALYEACKPEILSRKQEFSMAAIIHYLRQVIDGYVDRGNLDNAKRRISQLLDESIITTAEVKNASAGASTMGTEEKQQYLIKSWKQINLSNFNVEKLREEFKTAPYKHIEINDLRAFISGKLQQMMQRNVTRTGFAQKLQEIIDRYNSGGSLTEDYFDALVNFVNDLRDEELRAAREGLTENELEVFDLLKNDNLTKDQLQKVKLASRKLLNRLREEKPTVLVHDWHKDSQTRSQVKAVIEKILDDYLPEPYNRSLFAAKSHQIFEHFYLLAANGDKRAVA